MSAKVKTSDLVAKLNSLKATDEEIGKIQTALRKAFVKRFPNNEIISKKSKGDSYWFTIMVRDYEITEEDIAALSKVCPPTRVIKKNGGLRSSFYFV